MRVYRYVETRKETCSLGIKHTVYVYAGKDIEPIGVTYMYDDGYTNESENIYQDRQGVYYYARRTIDYYGQPSYIVYDNDGETTVALFKRRPASQPAVDTLGRII